MKRKQYMIKESNIDKRKEFYKYIINNYNLKVCDDEEVYYYSKFPFVVDFEKKQFWVCESITCCACAAQNKQIISIDEFMNKNLLW